MPFHSHLIFSIAYRAKLTPKKTLEMRLGWSDYLGSFSIQYCALCSL